MSHTIIYNAETDVIESKFQGVLTFDEVKKFISEGALISKEKNCRFFLSDYREVRLKLSILEIFEVPQLIKDGFASFGLNVYRLRRAVVAAEDLKDYRFYENVAFNRGQYAKVFTDIDEAKKWLSKKQGTSQ
jgi:hypothetical protein